MGFAYRTTFISVMLSLLMLGAATAQPTAESPDLIIESLPPPATSSPPAEEAPEKLMDSLPSKPEQAKETKGKAQPPEERKIDRPIKRVIIDAGHGGSDRGCEGPNGIKESAIALELAQQLEKHLNEKNALKVFQTRSKDAYVSAQDRTAVAVKNRGDILIQLHVASAPSPEARGVQVVCGIGSSSEEQAATAPGCAYAQRSLAIAEQMADALAEALDAERWPVFQVPSAIFRNVPMPAILIEVGFLSNADEAALLQTPEYQQKIVSAIASALHAPEEVDS